MAASQCLRGHATHRLLLAHPGMSPPHRHPARRQSQLIRSVPRTDSGAHSRNRTQAGSRPPTPSPVGARGASFYSRASSYAMRSARVASRALIRRIRSAPRSVNITASNRSVLDLPNNTSRSSAVECRLSILNRPNRSSKTVTASENATPCLVRLAAAFRESHLKVRAITARARQARRQP